MQVNGLCSNKCWMVIIGLPSLLTQFINEYNVRIRQNHCEIIPQIKVRKVPITQKNKYIDISSLLINNGSCITPIPEEFGHSARPIPLSYGFICGVLTNIYHNMERVSSLKVVFKHSDDLHVLFVFAIRCPTPISAWNHK